MNCHSHCTNTKYLILFAKVNVSCSSNRSFEYLSPIYAIMKPAAYNKLNDPILKEIESFLKEMRNLS